MKNGKGELPAKREKTFPKSGRATVVNRCGAALAAAALCLAAALAGCGANTPPSDTGAEAAVTKTLKLYIAGNEMPITWRDNDSVEALKRLAADGLTVKMSMYGGFEQVGPLGESLPRDDRQTDTDCGDVVLYSGNQIVIFYGSNSWSYTRLGHIDLPKEEMTGLLSKGDVTLTLQYE